MNVGGINTPFSLSLYRLSLEGDIQPFLLGVTFELDSLSLLLGHHNLDPNGTNKKTAVLFTANLIYIK